MILFSAIAALVALGVAMMLYSSVRSAPATDARAVEGRGGRPDLRRWRKLVNSFRFVVPQKMPISRRDKSPWDRLR